MTENDYLLAWSAYAVAGLGCLLVWCLMTDWMWRWLREPLRLVVAVLLFTPTVVDPGKEFLAPAIAIAAMDLLLDVGDNAWRAVADLSSYMLVAFVVYLVLVLIRWPIERAIRRSRTARTSVKSDVPEPTLREMLDDGNTWIDQNGDRRLRVDPHI
jgi:hypothetical protein